MAKQAATPTRKPAAPTAPPPKVNAPARITPPQRKPDPHTAPAPEPVRTRHSNAVAKDFGDESIKGGFSERPEAFKGKSGVTYIGRIVTKPIMFSGAYIENAHDKSKSFFMASRANIEVAKAAIDGDEAAWNEAAQECPLFERGYKVKQRFAVGLYIVCTIDSKNRQAPVKRFYPWVFAGERYQNLTAIAKSLPTLESGVRMTLQQVELQMSCTDDNFQKFNIAAISSPRDFKMKRTDVWEECKQFFDGETPDSPCYLIDDTIAPDPKRDMIASLDRADGKGKGQITEEVDDRPRQTAPARGATHATAGRRPAPQAEEVPDDGGDAETTRAIDEALGDLGEGEGGGEPANEAGGDGLDDL